MNIFFPDGTEGRFDARQRQVCDGEGEGPDEEVEQLLGRKVDRRSVVREDEANQEKDFRRPELITFCVLEIKRCHLA